MNKALIILNSLELRQKLYNDHHVIGFHSITPKEHVDNLKWLVIADPDRDECDPQLMYYSVDDRVKGYYSLDSYLVFENEEEFFNKLKEYYNV